MRVAVAMSGGVDSSVAAALLLEQGYEVIGLTMRVTDFDRGGKGCCGLHRDAQGVAARLGFPHYTLDFRSTFEELVIRDFVSEYGQGRTPNPCIRCNDLVKFGVLVEKARQLGAEKLATGHHARVVRRPRARWGLLKGRDRDKDQSYFLYRLTQEQMSSVLMPVGEYEKVRVRAMAKELGLGVAEKPESQEICFIPDDDYTGFLRRRSPGLFRPGPVFDTSGNVVGEHQGIASFTIGQRKGMGIALGERRYVVRIDAPRNEVILGSFDEARFRSAELRDVHWISGAAPRRRVTVVAKTRYQHLGASAVVAPVDDGRVSVRFGEPQWAITPGQAVVFYQDEAVLGGGIVARIEAECRVRRAGIS